MTYFLVACIVGILTVNSNENVSVKGVCPTEKQHQQKQIRREIVQIEPHMTASRHYTNVSIIVICML